MQWLQCEIIYALRCDSISIVAVVTVYNGWMQHISKCERNEHSSTRNVVVAIEEKKAEKQIEEPITLIRHTLLLFIIYSMATMMTTTRFTTTTLMTTMQLESLECTVKSSIWSFNFTILQFVRFNFYQSVFVFIRCVAVVLLWVIVFSFSFKSLFAVIAH